MSLHPTRLTLSRLAIIAAATACLTTASAVDYNDGPQLVSPDYVRSKLPYYAPPRPTDVPWWITYPAAIETGLKIFLSGLGGEAAGPGPGGFQGLYVGAVADLQQRQKDWDALYGFWYYWDGTLKPVDVAFPPVPAKPSANN